MAGSILSSLFSKSRFTIVNSATGIPTATGIKVKRVLCKYSSNVARHVREDGTCIVDTRIIRSSTLSIDLICPSIDDVTQVIALMNDRSNIYTITSKGIVFNNMMAQATSLAQSPEVLSAAPFRMYFKELLLQNSAPVTVANSGDSDSLQGGIQPLSVATQTVSGLFTRVTNAATGLFGG